MLTVSRDYRRLLVQLDETRHRFNDNWNAHLSRLRQCLDLRLFEQSFRELQVNFDCSARTFEPHITTFLATPAPRKQTSLDAQLQQIADMTEVGETVGHVDALLRQTNLFQAACDDNVARANAAIANGQQLISASGDCPADVVQPKCAELKRLSELLTDRMAKRLDALTKGRDLMERVEKVSCRCTNVCVHGNDVVDDCWQANIWCAKGIELLASQRIEKCSVSVDIAEKSLHEIRAFMLLASEFCASGNEGSGSNPVDGDGIDVGKSQLDMIRSRFEDNVTSDTKALVAQVRGCDCVSSQLIRHNIRIGYC